MSIATGYSVNTDTGYSVRLEIKSNTVNMGIRYGVEVEIEYSCEYFAFQTHDDTAIVILNLRVQSRFIERRVTLQSIHFQAFFSSLLQKPSALRVLDVDADS